MRIGPSDLILLAIFVLCGWQLKIVRPAWTMWNTMLLFLIPASALAVSLLVQPIAPAILVAKVFGIVTLSALYLAITSTVSTWQDVTKLLIVLVRVVTAQNVVVTGLYLANVDAPLINGDGSRLSGMLPDPNAYGSLLVVTFALLLATATSEAPLLGRRATQVAAITIPVSIVLTSSRSTWIAFGAVLMVYSIARPRAWLRYILIAGAALAIVAVLVVPELTEQQIALGSRGTGGRFELLSLAIDAFYSNPVFGIGIGQFFEQHDVIIHSTPAWFLGEFGLIGLTTIIGFMGMIARRALAVYRSAVEPAKSTALGLGLAFVGMATMSLGIEALYQRWWWVIIGLVVAIYSRLAQGIDPTLDST